MMASLLFYNLPKIDQIAVNLFYGWGYNFYRLENQLRQDDLLVRSHVSKLLGLSRGLLEKAQQNYRRVALPPPTRDNPRPTPEALAGAETLERLSAAVGDLEGRIRALPVPEDDRMTQRYRQEAETLVALGTCDTRLVGRAQMLFELLQNKDQVWILTNTADIEEGFSAIEATLLERLIVLG